jgi:hypothetical protein
LFNKMSRKLFLPESSVATEQNFVNQRGGYGGVLAGV